MERTMDLVPRRSGGSSAKSSPHSPPLGDEPASAHARHPFVTLPPRCRFAVEAASRPMHSSRFLLASLVFATLAGASYLGCSDDTPQVAGSNKEDTGTTGGTVQT